MFERVAAPSKNCTIGVMFSRPNSSSKQIIEVHNRASCTKIVAIQSINQSINKLKCYIFEPTT